MKKIILFYPKLVEKETDDFHWFPFSLLPLAQKLDQAGYSVKIIDRRVDHISEKDIAAQINSADFIGISAKSGYQIQDGLDIAKVVREVKPSVPIIWGGWHATILPQETVTHDLVDYVVTGRGEETIVRLLNALCTGDTYPSSIQAVAYESPEQKGLACFTGYIEPTLVNDDAMKYEQYIDIDKYLNPQTNAIGYFSGHGCVYNCSFCARRFMTNKYSPYPVEKVIDDLMFFKNRYGIQMVRFQDDNFFINLKRSEEIADLMLLNKIKLKWGANIRANVVPRIGKDCLNSFVESGLNSLAIGAESADAELLEKIDKGTDPADIETTINILNDYEIIPKVSYIFGLPGDNIEKMRKTIKQVKYLKKINKKVLCFACFFQPYPGTELYDEAIKCGYPKFSGLEQWSTMKPQSCLGKIPWLSINEMDQYQKEFNASGCFSAY